MNKKRALNKSCRVCTREADKVMYAFDVWLNVQKKVRKKNWKVMFFLCIEVFVYASREIA